MTNTTQENEPLTRDQFKVLALRERVAQLTAEYEDKVADLRVELTFVSQELEQLKQAQGQPDAEASEGRKPEDWPRVPPEDR